MIEIWKVIEDFPDYAVSDMGRIKRIKKGKSGNSKIRILKTYKNYKGYLKVFFTKSGKPIAKYAHLLVLITFVGKKEGYQTNHKDGNKENNKLDNLEWCTGSENVIHSYRTGLASNLGERHPRSILKNDDVIKIKRLLKEEKLTHKEIGKVFGVCRSTISKIKSNKLWSHIEEK